MAQAAVVLVSGVTALRGLRDAGKLRPGQHVLIHGASGGIGTFAVQIANALVAEVTAVCSTKNVEMVRSIGADHVIDYTREDFINRGGRFDVILDNVANHSSTAGGHSPAMGFSSPTMGPNVPLEGDRGCDGTRGGGTRPR